MTKRILGAIALALPLALLSGCRTEHGPGSTCAAASELRLGAANDLARGATAGALATIERANAMCPAGRKDSRADEVKLLAELARCDDARALADTIEADPDRSDAAWLSASVARARCDRDKATPPRLEDAIAASEFALGSVDDVHARRSWDRALALARGTGVPVVADCTRWGHKKSVVSAYLAALDAIVLVDGDRALALRTTDGREVRNFSGQHGAIEVVTTSRDGRVLLTASTEEVVAWSIDRALPLFRVAGHAPIALSAEGTRFAFTEGERTVRVGLVAGGATQAIVEGSAPTALALPDGGIAVATATSFHVLGPTGVERWKSTRDLAASIILPRANDSFLLGNTDGMLTFLDVVSRATSRRVATPLEGVYAIDPDGTGYVSSRDIDDGHGASHDVFTVVDLATTKAVDLDVGSLRGFLGGGRFFNLNPDDHLSVYDVTTGRGRVLLPSASAKLDDLAMSPDGSALRVTFTAPRLGLSARYDWVWTADGATPIASPGYYLVFGGGSRFLVAHHGTSIDVWSARTGKPFTRHDVEAMDESSPIVSPSGRFVLQHTKSGYVRVDLARKLEDAQLADSHVLDFDDDDRIRVERLGGYVLLDPIDLSPVGKAEPPPTGDFMCLDGTKRDCIATLDAESPSKELRRSYAYVDAAGTKLPFEPFVGHEPGRCYGPSDRRFVAIPYEEGSILFYDFHGGEPMAFRPFVDGTGGYVRAKDGRIELFGSAATRAVCRVGAFSLPIAACADRVVDGLLRGWLGRP